MLHLLPDCILACLALWIQVRTCVLFLQAHQPGIGKLADGTGMHGLRKIQAGMKNPGEALRYVLAICRGYWVPIFCRVRFIRFTAGRNLRIRGKIVFQGPGRVVFGDNVLVERVVTPWTYHRDAVIEIGSNSYLNGTRFGCQESIAIGARAILSDASISDTDFHSTHVDRRSPDAPVRVRPVIIEENVWISAAAGILAGTHIGRNSVVGYGAVCSGKYPSNSIIVGNPGRVVKQVPGAE